MLAKSLKLPHHPMHALSQTGLALQRTGWFLVGNEGNEVQDMLDETDGASSTEQNSLVLSRE